MQLNHFLDRFQHKYRQVARESVKSKFRSVTDAEVAYTDGQYKRIEANQPVPLNDGDQIFLGAWTTLTLRSRINKRRGIPR